MKIKLLSIIAFVVLSTSIASAQALYAENISTPDGSISFLRDSKEIPKRHFNYGWT